MLRAITVDDEQTALQWFRRVAAETPQLSIEGEFQYAEDALAFVRTHQADVAFLDIEMSEMSGLELAERLVQLDPYLRIVFVTAYDRYALEAFHVHAVGYLLKPLDGGALAEQVNRLIALGASRPAPDPRSRLSVKCFGQFSVSTLPDGAPAAHWKTAKTEELFALLTHYQGRSKTKENLMETLWPDMDPARSLNLFRVTCTYLRSALSEIGFPDLLMRELDGYRVDASALDCDVYRFRQAVCDTHARPLAVLEASAALYGGAYLEDKPYLWASAVRTQLETDYQRLQNRITDAYCVQGQTASACRALEQLLLHDPCDEAAVIRLIRLRLQTGDRAAAQKAYRSYEAALREELDASPAASLQKLLGIYHGRG